MSTINEDEELRNLRTLYRPALKKALIFVALSVALVVPAEWSGLIFVYYIWLPLFALYFLAQAIWFGVPLLIHAVPSAWKTAVQVTIVLVLWSGPFFYFAQVPSTLESIATRTSVWGLVPPAVIALLVYTMASAITATRSNVRPFLVAIAVVTILCLMVKGGFEVSDADGYLVESAEALTSPDERAYWNYVLFSVVAFGGIIVGHKPRRSPRSGA